MVFTLERLANALDTVRSLVVIATALALGLLAPPPPAAAALVAPVVVVLVYASFRGFSTAVVSARSVTAVALALVVGSLVLPVLVATVGPRVLAGPTFLGVFVVVAGPTTVGSAIVWTRIDGGDAALTTLIATVSVALSPIVVPVLFAGLLSTTVSIDPVSIGLDLLLVLVGGAALRLLVPGDAVGERTVDRIAVAAIAVLVYVAVGTTGFAGATPATVAVVVLAVLLLHLVVVGLVAMGGRLLGLSWRARRSVVYGAGLKNLGVSLLVAASVPAAPVFPIVVFYVAQQLVSSIRAERGAVSDSRPSERPL